MKGLRYDQRTGPVRAAVLLLAACSAYASDSQPGQFGWSSDGRKFAFVEQGELRVTDIKTGAVSTLMRTDCRLEWAPDGSAILFSCPSSLSWLDLATRKSRILVARRGALEDAKISPDGRWVSFVKDHNLWLVSLKRGEVRALTKEGSKELRKGEPDRLYRKEFDLRSAYWWAPDSSAIAFLETQERQAANLPRPGSVNPVLRVSVAPLDGRGIRTMETGAPTDAYIPRVMWLPDSKHLAIQSLDRKQSNLTLLLADTDTGHSRVLLSESDGYWINIRDDLRFLGDRQQFIWSSERGGYRHLYLYGMDGRLIRQLTRGRWEVSGVAAVDEARGVVYFTAAEKTPLERHLYRIALDGSGFARITKQDGWHEITFAPDAKTFVDRYSSAVKPPAENFYHTDGTLATAMDKGLAAQTADIVSPPEFLQVKAHDGEMLNAMMLKPPGFEASHKYPVIVFTNGGPREQVVRNAWGGDAFLWNEKMAARGFLIFALDNRGSGGRGHLFEEPIHCRLGAQELSDQRDGVTFLRTLPYVDAAHMGIWGTGYGGQMALHAIFDDPQDFMAAFADSPIADWLLSDTAFAERYLEVPRGFSEEFDESSPVKEAARLRGKLLVSASADDEDSTANLRELEKALTDAGKHAEIVLPPQGTDKSAAQTAIFRRATEFFLENLKGTQPDLTTHL